MTEAQTISNIVVGPHAVGVGANHAGVGVATLLPGAVDVAVAEGEVLVLVLGVVLGAGHAGSSGPHLSNNRGGNSSNSRGGSDSSNSGSSHSDRSNSRGGDGPDGGDRGGGGVSPGVGVGVAEGGGPGASVEGGVQCVSVSLATGQGGDGKDDLIEGYVHL